MAIVQLIATPLTPLQNSFSRDILIYLPHMATAQSERLNLGALSGMMMMNKNA